MEFERLGEGVVSPRKGTVPESGRTATLWRIQSAFFAQEQTSPPLAKTHMDGLIRFLAGAGYVCYLLDRGDHQVLLSRHDDLVYTLSVPVDLGKVRLL